MDDVAGEHERAPGVSEPGDPVPTLPPPQPQPRADWYDDPEDPSQYRYWDGTAWTDHTASKSEGSVRAASSPYTGSPQRPAKFSQRLGAYLLDTLIVVVAAAVIGGIVGLLTYFAGVAEAALDPVAQLVGWIVSLGYFIALEGSESGATVGKGRLDVKVVAADGSRAGYGKATGRNFAKFLSGIPLGLGYLWALWDAENRTWHDMLSGTRVVRTS